jgi:hypothetical protein
MTLQQMEYIVALDKYRHFVLAAEACGVTQPTLSAMIQKLEEELDVKIFNRDRKNITPTRIGEKIIRQAQIVLNETQCIKEVVADETDSMNGNLRIGILPTIAPYLVPDFIHHFRYTIIPELHIASLTEKQKAHVLPLQANPPAQRHVSILIKEDFIRERMVNAVIDTLKSIIPAPMLEKRLSSHSIRLRHSKSE